MENCYFQVCDTKNSQCDVTWTSDVTGVILNHLVKMRVTVFFHKDDSKSLFAKKTKELIYYKDPRLYLLLLCLTLSYP